jgi:hypothetical protein
MQSTAKNVQEYIESLPDEQALVIKRIIGMTPMESFVQAYLKVKKG